jgi:hypothetical protein
MSNRGSKTAEELLEELSGDLEHRRRVAERRQKALARGAEISKAEAPVVADLVNAGFPVESVWDLFNKRLNYRDAIPILLEWLPKISNQGAKEGIVRALSVKWAKPDAAPLLVREFHRIEDPGGSSLGWAIGNALEVVADDAVFDDLVEIVRDPSYGRARQMIAVALGKMKDPRAVDVLLGLLDDEDVTGHAIMALGRLGAQEARPAIEGCLSHSKPWVRKEAKKALAKIDKARNRPR